MSSVAKATRSKTELYLLCDSVSEFTGSKLPSLRMALGYFLHHHIDLKETIRQSSDVTIEKIAQFWNKARIPMRDHQHCQAKLEQTFEEWRLLKKNKARKSPTQLAREMAFVSRLEDLFDVAHADALTTTLVLQEDKDFLLAQREKGRRGVMAGLDSKLAAKMKRASEREETLRTRRHQMEHMKQAAASTAELKASESQTSSSEDGEKLETCKTKSEGTVVDIKSHTPKRKRGRKPVITPELAAALDRTNVSDRKAVFVVAETAKILGQNIDELALNRDSVRRNIIEYRSQRAANIKAKFQGNTPLVVHWDGKLIPELIWEREG